MKLDDEFGSILKGPKESRWRSWNALKLRVISFILCADM